MINLTAEVLHITVITKSCRAATLAHHWRLILTTGFLPSHIKGTRIAGCGNTQKDTLLCPVASSHFRSAPLLDCPLTRSGYLMHFYARPYIASSAGRLAMAAISRARWKPGGGRRREGIQAWRALVREDQLIPTCSLGSGLNVGGGPLNELKLYSHGMDLVLGISNSFEF